MCDMYGVFVGAAGELLARLPLQLTYHTNGPLEVSMHCQLL
jgi:hypothetical protein